MPILREAVRRRARRVSVSLAGTLRGRSARPVTAVDLSLTGCLLRCEAALDRGSIHDLELPLAERGLRAKARVTDSSRDGAAFGFLVGLEFVQLPARDLDALRAFLDAEARRCARSR
jgi:c-di-GMP-binding flagellar brake protein YcgR